MCNEATITIGSLVKLFFGGHRELVSLIYYDLK